MKVAVRCNDEDTPSRIRELSAKIGLELYPYTQKDMLLARLPQEFHSLTEAMFMIERVRKGLGRRSRITSTEVFLQLSEGAEFVGLLPYLLKVEGDHARLQEKIKHSTQMVDKLVMGDRR